eukprot:UN26050
MPGKLVFMRHGQSEWNASGQFTGWVDVGLTDQGIEEATFGGQLLRDSKIKFDVMYTSVLKRAIRTGTIALQECNQDFVPVVKSMAIKRANVWRFTRMQQERNRCRTWKRTGSNLATKLRVPPPEIDIGNQYWPGRERHKYGNVPLKDIPLTECLKDVIARVMPFWEQNIMADVMAGKNVLVAAHGNSIRAICKYLDQIPDDVIPGLEIPTGIPLVYNLDD